MQKRCTTAEVPAPLLALLPLQLIEKLVVLACPHPSAYKDPELFNEEMIGRWLVNVGMGVMAWWLSLGAAGWRMGGLRVP